MFEAKFTNAALLKKIVEAIKELVSEAPFDCTENSMCLQAMDGSHVALISLKLDIGLFEVFRCDRTIALGLSMGELSKVLKCSKSEDTLMIRFEDSEQDMVTFTFEDTKGRKQDITLKLMDRVRLSMCDNVPLVVEYDIEGNGFLRFFLAPKIDEDKETMDD
ncbi:hypothetical protein niasHT_021460 [Heterodera trifolii]|uniref:Proliferating cell nuclear antigen PCNA N-terminal domain-containing protein n=1 Tax=Heterodera trifolii TaxID=157864 RepID=A0ABD2KIW6_9BILA